MVLLCFLRAVWVYVRFRLVLILTDPMWIIILFWETAHLPFDCRWGMTANRFIIVNKIENEFDQLIVDDL